MDAEPVMAESEAKQAQEPDTAAEGDEAVDAEAKELVFLKKVEGMVKGINGNLTKIAGSLETMEKTMGNTEVVVGKWLKLWKSVQNKENAMGNVLVQ